MNFFFFFIQEMLIEYLFMLGNHGNSWSYESNSLTILIAMKSLCSVNSELVGFGLNIIWHCFSFLCCYLALSIYLLKTLNRARRCIVRNFQNLQNKIEQRKQQGMPAFFIMQYKSSGRLHLNNDPFSSPLKPLIVEEQTRFRKII